MGIFNINRLNSGGGVIVTYKCSAACLHCSYASSPQRKGEYMTKNQAVKIFDALIKMGCFSVHIGGGEPFINFGKLLDVCAAARERGMDIDYIETNASWHTSDDKTCEYLHKLMNEGVPCLLISVDPFHNEFVPLDKVRGLAKCCKKTGMQMFIWQSQFERIVANFSSSSTHALSEYTDTFGGDFISGIANAYGLSYNGRALKLADMIYNLHDAEYYLQNRGYNSQMRTGDSCRRIISANHFHVDAYENYIPPGCMGFRINIDDLQREMNKINKGNKGNNKDGKANINNEEEMKEKYANILRVIEGGLDELYAHAVSLGFEPKKDGYSHKCALCFDIKKYILSKTDAKDIGPCDFFDEY